MKNINQLPTFFFKLLNYFKRKIDVLRTIEFISNNYIIPMQYDGNFDFVFLNWFLLYMYCM